MSKAFDTVDHDILLKKLSIWYQKQQPKLVKKLLIAKKTILIL